MSVTSEEELAGLRAIGRIVANTLAAMGRALEPEMTTQDLDSLGRDLLDRAGAVSAPQAAYGFPGTTCISLNEEIAHGIPGPRVIAPGDLVNIDVSASKEGFFADTGASFSAPPHGPRWTASAATDAGQCRSASPRWPPTARLAASAAPSGALPNAGATR